MVIPSILCIEGMTIVTHVVLIDKENESTDKSTLVKLWILAGRRILHLRFPIGSVGSHFRPQFPQQYFSVSLLLHIIICSSIVFLFIFDFLELFQPPAVQAILYLGVGNGKYTGNIKIIIIVVKFYADHDVITNCLYKLYAVRLFRIVTYIVRR